MVVCRAVRDPGLRVVCIREVQKTLKESSKRLIEDKIAHHGVNDQFDELQNETRTPGGGVIMYQGMQDHNAQSIKSLEGFDIAWVEEAQTLSKRSLELLRPTLRKPGSELWFGWNPRSASDPVDKFFRGETPPEQAIIVEVNHSDNPWFPKELEEERRLDLRLNPDRYDHIWEGDYEPVAIGAIWNRTNLHENRKHKAPTMGRIVVAVDPAASNEEDSDEHGVIVAGVGEDQRGYLLEDASLKGTPRQWADQVIAMFDKWEADCIVAEVNNGGDMVKHTIQTRRASAPVKKVWASRGKHVRAEPISALYSLGMVSHVGTFNKLENQMCKMTASGYDGDGSPDRCDAMVWAFTELFPKMVKKQQQKKTRDHRDDRINHRTF